MRVKKATCLKLTVFAVIVTIVVINIKDADQDINNQVFTKDDVDKGGTNIANLSINISRSDNHKGEATSKLTNISNLNDNSEQSNKIADSLAGERIHGLPNINNSRGNSQLKHLKGNSSNPDIENILLKIKEANKDQVIHNEDLFGPLTNATTVILVQVHDRIKYVRHLIKSFSQASGIDNTLLIFSHDVWDEGINTLVSSIDFCRVLQIFYPFSLQTHTNTFPGESANDCPRDAKQPQADSMSCTNAAWPDLHGHYREAQFTQTKHHWWWKANHVFHSLQATKYFQGLVLFFEEDHYVTVDFLHVLSLMNAEKKKSFPEVDILCLGTYLKKFNFKANGKQPPRSNNARKNKNLPEKHRNKNLLQNARSLKELHVDNILSSPPPFSLRHLLWLPSFLSSIIGTFHKAEVTEWISAKHNMGMAFTRTEWNKMLSCSSQFCQYDDYNWDWSLQHVSLSCMKEKLKVMLIKGPRVFHIGECGVHHKKSNCDSNVIMRKVEKIIKSAKAYLFPKSLSISKPTLKKKLKLKKANGGWGDKRDHELCMNFTLSLDGRREK